MAIRNLQEQIVVELLRLLEPLLKAVSNPGHRSALLDSLGWDLTALTDETDFEEWLEDVGAAVTDLIPFVEKPPETFSDVKLMLRAVGRAAATLHGLPGGFQRLAAAANAPELFF